MTRKKSSPIADRLPSTAYKNASLEMVRRPFLETFEHIYDVHPVKSDYHTSETTWQLSIVSTLSRAHVEERVKASVLRLARSAHMYIGQLVISKNYLGDYSVRFISCLRERINK